MQGWFAWVMWLVVHLRSILGVRNKVIVLLNWVWNYFTYDQSMRMIVYARKAKEIRDREKVEETTHWGKNWYKRKRTPLLHHHPSRQASCRQDDRCYSER